MNIIANIDLLSVGIAIALNLMLGFAIFFQDKKNITYKWFFIFVLVNTGWSIFNYANYKVADPLLILWFIRAVLFFAVLQASSFFILMYVFPVENKIFHPSIKYILIPLSIVVAILTLTPFVFSGIKIAPMGQVSQPIPAAGIGIFALVTLFCVITGLIIMFRKLFRASKDEKKQFRFLLSGLTIMFALIIIFNLIFPIILQSTRFIPLSALFTFPFIALTAYAIYRHSLFNVKVATTAFLTAILAIVTFSEILFSSDLISLLFRSGVFILVLVFGINLIRNVFKEVQQRERIETLAQELEKANERLKELDQLKTEFVSLATHQIRSPLTAIKGYISLIQEGDYGPVSKEIASVIDILFQSTNNLVTIVGDFLDVSRIEQGRMKYDFTDFDLGKLVDQVAQEFKPNVEKRGLAFTFDFENDKNYMVHADQGKVKQVIGNILDNSIKYTPKGWIHVALQQKNDKNLIEISDSGVGIPKGTIPKLFQKFTRASNANEANILGTGLGLYVAKQMIEAHQGRVWAESEGIDKGSQFYIELPHHSEAPTEA